LFDLFILNILSAYWQSRTKFETNLHLNPHDYQKNITTHRIC